MDRKSRRRLVTGLALAVCASIGVAVALVLPFGSGDRGGELKLMAQAHAGDSAYGDRASLVGPGRSGREGVVRRHVPEPEAAKEPAPGAEGSERMGLSRSAVVDAQERLREGIRRAKAELNEVLAGEGWGREAARCRYLLMRREIALQKLLEGEFEVGYSPGDNPVRRPGEADFVCISTQEYYEGDQLWLKVLFDENDEALLRVAREGAAAEAIAEWKSFVDDFNGLSFEVRKERVEQSKQAQESIRRLRREMGADHDDARDTELQRLKKVCLPWYLAIDEASFLVRVHPGAMETARRRGGM